MLYNTNDKGIFVITCLMLHYNIIEMEIKLWLLIRLHLITFNPSLTHIHGMHDVRTQLAF